MTHFSDTNILEILQLYKLAFDSFIVTQIIIYNILLKRVLILKT